MTDETDKKHTVELDCCNICLEDFQPRSGNGVVLCGQCNKSFCIPCIFKSPKENKCPVCNQLMDEVWPTSLMLIQKVERLHNEDLEKDRLQQELIEQLEEQVKRNDQIIQLQNQVIQTTTIRHEYLKKMLTHEQKVKYWELVADDSSEINQKIHRRLEEDGAKFNRCVENEHPAEAIPDSSPSSSEENGSEAVSDQPPEPRGIKRTADHLM